MLTRSPCPRTLEDQVVELRLDGRDVGLLDLPVVDVLARFLVFLAALDGFVVDLGERVDALGGRRFAPYR